jgi:glycosyltransferase 2 family protein
VARATVGKEEKKRARAISRLITGVVWGVVIFALFLLWGDIDEIGELVLSVPMLFLSLSIGSTLLSYLIRFAKWHYMLKKLAIHIEIKKSLHIFLIGLGMSITPGKVGELFKSFLLKKIGNIHISRSASAVFVDRFTDLFAMLLLISLGVSLFAIGYIPFFCFALLLLGMMLILRSSSFCVACIQHMDRHPFLRKHKEFALTLYQSIYALLNWGPFLWTICLSTSAWLMESLSLYILMDALGIQLSLLHDIFIFSLGTLAGALSMLPGGLGVAEGSMTGLFMYFGLDAATAIAVTLLIRFVTLWLGVFIGFLLFISKREYHSL